MDEDPPDPVVDAFASGDPTGGRRGVGNGDVQRFRGIAGTARGGRRSGLLGMVSRPLCRRGPGRGPRACDPLDELLGVHWPALRPAQRLGLARWAYGAVIAGRACQVAGLAARWPRGSSLHAWPQSLRAWLDDGADRAAPGRPQLAVAPCFAPRRRWVVAWWQGRALALAVDATTLKDRLVVPTPRVVDRGGASPVAWQVRPATAAGEWMPLMLDLVEPPPVGGGAAAGLAPPAATAAERHLPPGRAQAAGTGRPPDAGAQPRRGRGRRRLPGQTRSPGRDAGRRLGRGGGRAVGAADRPAAAAVGVGWYGRRAWIERGCRALTGMGWPWERTRRTDPDRGARHWLVWAVATIWTLAYGTRAEDADRVGIAPATLRVAPPPPPRAHRRPLSVCARGIGHLRWQLRRVRRRWPRLWLVPEPWPDPPPGLVSHRALTPLEDAHAQYLPL